MRAGDYSTLYTRLAVTVSQDDYGGLVQEWSAAGELWGYQEELKAEEKAWYASAESRADCKIYLRNFPTISSQDRLEDDIGQTYELDGINYGDNETIVTAHRILHE